jgi:hypothetical protein
MLAQNPHKEAEGCVFVLRTPPLIGAFLSQRSNPFNKPLEYTDKSGQALTDKIRHFDCAQGRLTLRPRFQAKQESILTGLTGFSGLAVFRN